MICSNSSLFSGSEELAVSFGANVIINIEMNSKKKNKVAIKKIVSLKLASTQV